MGCRKTFREQQVTCKCNNSLFHGLWQSHIFFGWGETRELLANGGVEARSLEDNLFPVN